MKKLLIFFLSIVLVSKVNAQYVYTIKADSVKLTACDSTELIIENHTQGVPGFLYNKGNGRTEFRKALVKLNDTTYLIGADTLKAGPQFWAANGTHIYNTNPGNVGIRRRLPLVTLDLPGPVNIDDTSSYRINYRPMFRIGDIQPDSTYANLFIGDSASQNGSFTYSTQVGHMAGYNSGGSNTTYIGYSSGNSGVKGDNNTFTGAYSGWLSAPLPVWPNDFTDNTYNGAYAGAGAEGGYNTYVGSVAGNGSLGSQNSYFGYAAGAPYNQEVDNDNCYFGFFSGQAALGGSNTFVGYESGYTSTGSNNVFLGNNAATYWTGSKNIIIGDSASYQWGGPFGGDYNTIIGANADAEACNSTTLLGSGISLGSHGLITNTTALGAGVLISASNTFVLGNGGVQSWLFGVSDPVSGKALIVGSNSGNGNGAYLTSGGVWTNASDRNKKENFKVLDDNEILSKINKLPVTRWNYKGLAEQHIGPVAQDFHRLFDVGSDDKTISTIDPSGIALAGIQGLYRKWKNAESKAALETAKVKDQQSEIDQLKSQLQEQKNQMQQILEKLNSLETAINQKNKGDLAKSN